MYYNVDSTASAISKISYASVEENSNDSALQFRSSTMTNEETSKTLVEGFKVIEIAGDIFDAPKYSLLIRE